ncbi:phytoene desaturase family protein [Balneolaceae bacterium ANBcel3]|nr:phytoene desaturase family protein [Balneolaceae bacterium ANBcel3]
MKITIIGAGIGGLASAALLASRGHTVDLFEQNAFIGGKATEKRIDGFRFDTGPSVFTMPFILDQVFEQCGEKTSEYLRITKTDPICRYFFSDGVLFDHTHDDARNKDALLRIAPEDIEAWDQFAAYTKKLYDKTTESFLFNPLYSIQDIPFKHLHKALSIDIFSTVSQRVDSIFSSSRLRQLFKRYTTYNGSSPYQAPATFNVIAHVEQQLGGYYIKGGMYQIVQALSRLAEKQGARIHTGVRVERINVSDGNVTGTQINGARFDADVVVANSDAILTYLNLLPENTLSSGKRKRLARIEPSCSGFVILLGITRTYEALRHHTIFFSDQYQQEFDSIFLHKELPANPTIYIANTSSSTPDDAPEGGSNLFILVNAPYTHKQNWNELKETYTEHILMTLESRGLSGLRDSVAVCEVITPGDFERIHGSNRGSIYGTSSNSLLSAFLRPKNADRTIKNLFFCGGGTHPGGGIPLVLQSALNVDTLIGRASKT